MIKYYVKQSSSEILKLEVKPHESYGEYYIPLSGKYSPYVLKNLCFDTREEAFDCAIKKLIKDGLELDKKIIKIEEKILQLKRQRDEI